MMPVNLAKNVCWQRHNKGKKSPRHSQFVCRFGDTVQIQHIMAKLMGKKNTQSSTGQPRAAEVAAAAVAAAAPTAPADASAAAANTTTNQTMTDDNDN
jgi:hypothetical protein